MKQKKKKLTPEIAIIKPKKFYDKVLDKQIEICTSPQFTTIHVGDRVFYFTPNGDFDGTSRPMGEDVA